MRILPFIILSFSMFTYAQSVRVHGSISNSATSFPVTGVPEVFKEIHPGVNLAISKNLSDNYISYFSLEARISAYYHRFVHTVFRIQPEFTYHIAPTDYFMFKAGIGLGYAGAIEPNKPFSISENGQFIEESAFRSQFTGNLTLGPIIHLSPNQEYGPQLEILYRLYLQGPFVDNYVPVLPINELSIGVSFPILSLY